MSYHLLALLLIPLVGSGLLFALKGKTGKYMAFGIALIQMLVTFFVLYGFDAKPTVDSVLQQDRKSVV